MDFEKEKQLTKGEYLNCKDMSLRIIVLQYSEVLQEELPTGLPSQNEVDHDIIMDPEA